MDGPYRDPIACLKCPLHGADAVDVNTRLGRLERCPRLVAADAAVFLTHPRPIEANGGVRAAANDRFARRDGQLLTVVIASVNPEHDFGGDGIY